MHSHLGLETDLRSLGGLGSNYGDFAPESTPLLAASTSDSATGATEAEDRKQALRLRVIPLISVLIVLIALPTVMASVSQVRIFEMIYCEQHYRDTDPGIVPINGSIPEEMCKIDAVQAKVSTLRGWQIFWHTVPALVVAIPMGSLADRYGRKWLIVTNIVALYCRLVWQFVVCAYLEVFDLRLIYVDSVLSVFGGGYSVMASVMLASASDVTAKASMAPTFFRLNAVGMMCNMFGPLAAAAAMKQDPWLAFYLALGIQAFSIPIAFLLPETSGASTSPEKSCLLVMEEIADQDNCPPGPPLELRSRHGAAAITTRCIQFISSNCQFLLRDWRIPILIFAHALHQSQEVLQDKLLQYIPQRYPGWTMPDVMPLLSLQSFLSVLTLIIILPAFSSYYYHYHSPNHSKQHTILLIRLSYTILATTIILTGVSPSTFSLLPAVLLSALCAGLDGALRSLLTFWSSDRSNETGRLFAVMGFAQCLGVLVEAPCVAGLYNAGLGWTAGKGQEGGSKIMLGLPWIVFGVLLGAVAVGIWIVDWRRGDEDVVVDEDGARWD